VLECPTKSLAVVSALGMYDWSLCAKKMLLREFFLSSLSGNENNLKKGDITLFITCTHGA
jgi:hypothetical protein